MNNAVEAGARIISYEPKMDLKAGGMMEIRDSYMADYDGHINSLVLGVRTVKLKNMKEVMKKAPLIWSIRACPALFLLLG